MNRNRKPYNEVTEIPQKFFTGVRKISENRVQKEEKVMDEKKNKEEVISQDMSEQELDSVSGGIFDERDYAADGCAASVEYGSDCWGTDGGCHVVHIQYSHPPVKEKCWECGKQTVYMSFEGVNVYYYTCRTCGAKYIQFNRNPWKRIHV